MPNIQNSTTAYLFKGVPLSADYTDVINTNNMLNFLISNYEYIVKSNLSYQNMSESINRTSNSIYFDGALDGYEEYNYIAINNSGEDRVYFCFIDSLKAENANTTRIDYSIDLFHTFFNAGVLGACEVVREHTATDGIGYIPDSIPHDDLVLTNVWKESLNPNNYKILIFIDPAIKENQSAWEWIGSAIESADVSGVNKPKLPIYVVQDSADHANAWIGWLNQNHASQYVLGVYLCPVAITGATTWTSKYTNFDLYSPLGHGYVPHNQMVYHPAYQRIEFGVSGGGATTIPGNALGGEEYSGLNIDIGTVGNVGGGLVARVSFGDAYNDGVIFSTGQMIEIPYRQSNIDGWYTSLAQTAPKALVNIGTQAIAGFGIGGVVGAGVGALSGIGTTVAQKGIEYWEAKTSNSQINGGIVPAIMGLYGVTPGFYANRYALKQSDAQRLDNFFDCYGYLVKTYKVPRISGHSPYNYVQTNGCNIKGNMPNPARAIIKNVFDKGVRVWSSKPQ